MLGGLDPEEQLRMLYNMKSGEQMSTLVSCLGTVAQDIAKTHTLVKKAVDAAESVAQN